MSRIIEVKSDYVARPWAVPVHQGIVDHRFSVIVANRGSGKTYLVSNQLAQDASEHDNATQGPDGRYLFISPYLKQARDTAWVYLKEATKNIPGVQYQESLLQVRLPNGAWICLYGADDPQALRGMHPHGIVVDEVKDMKPETWTEIILPMLHSHKAWVVFIGTAKGLNLLSKVYFDALKDPAWYAGLFTVYDTKMLSEEEIQFYRNTMSERQFAAEMMCDFNAGSDSTLIPLDLARSAAGRHLRIDQYQFAAKTMGVDPARLGDDRFVVVRRQGLACFPPAVSRGNDTQAGISLIHLEAEAWQPDAIFIDPGGNPGVYDGMKRTRWPVHAVDFGSSATDKRFQNKRAEIWFRMKDWLKDGGCIPNDQAFIADLCSTEYDYRNAKGKFALESKDDIRKRGLPSPDCFVAGTLVQTPSGPRPIESIVEGDEVSTPMGSRVVVNVWEVETDALTTATFSDGSALIGKPGHEVFTWNAGFVCLDALSFANGIETYSLCRRAAWWLSRRWFTEAKPSGFKRQAGISSREGSLLRRDFFIAASGRITMAPFLRAMRSIIETAIGGTTPSRTLIYGQSASTLPLTLPNACWTMSSERSSFWRGSAQPRHGIDQKPVSLGTPNTEQTRGSEGKPFRSDAHTAISPTKHSLNPGPSSVLRPARPARPIAATKRLLAYAFSAARRSLTTAFGLRRVVPVSVRTESVEPISVYNLTLDRDNVYFANGVLVANCADALATTFSFPIAPRAMKFHDQSAKRNNEWDPLSEAYR